MIKQASVQGLRPSILKFKPPPTTVNPMTLLKPGQEIAERYRVERMIARGGMGEVYLCEQLGLGRKTAIKLLNVTSGDEADQKSFRERFELEAKTLAGLDHPNIVTVFEYGKLEDGTCFLALEYVAGQRFTDLVNEGPMAPERLVELMLQVCQALRYAHRRGVVHRDLKPSNLLVWTDDDGAEQVKVVDFGLVKCMTEPDQNLTRTGMVIGSPHCMSPEQINGAELDHRSDIYSLGALMFRALTNRWPFHGETGWATMLGHLTAPVPSTASANKDVQVPKGMERIIHRCLAKSPDDRFATVEELMDALHGALDGRSGTEGPSLVQQIAPRLAHEARNALQTSRVLVALAIIVSVGALLYAWAEHAAPQPDAQSEPTSEVQVEPPSPEPASPADEPPPTAVDGPPEPEPELELEPNNEAATAPVEPESKPSKPKKKKSPPKVEEPSSADEPEGYKGLPSDF